ncbi:insulin-like growth factor 3 [Cololabis saira]|uniref:insulin-like growth factor 3 n=1 Tax=Cololabis saira TaxID=129043 RepID=UPI002AD3F4AD|nr:insulin-like growth factor 3 [Cololabis saira]
MPSLHSHPARSLTLKVLCVRICMFYTSLSLSGWLTSSEAARLRCGSELLSDLIFVCGDRGIYLGKGSWSGYGARPRRKGIVDQCCKSSGCELHHLEMYCATPKSQNPTTSTSTTTSTTASTGTSATLQTTTAQDMFQAVFQKRLLEEVGAPNSPQRKTYRKKTQPLPEQKSRVSLGRRRKNMESTTEQPPSSTGSPL